MMPMNPLSLPGSMSRFYGQTAFNPSNQTAFMNNLPGGNARSSPNTDDSKPSTKSRNPTRSPMSINTNQSQRSGSTNQFGATSQPPSNPTILSPNHQQLLNSHQQILNSGFSPAVIAAATSALSSNNPQFSQLIQHQLQMQQQQFSQLQHFQNQFQQNQATPKQQQQQPDVSSVKKEPKDVTPAPTNPSPKTTTVRPLSQPASVSTPPAVAGQGLASNQSSCYVPEVEAISPTPEDQKENSNLQAVKDKIITEICKVEKDIASTQYQFDLLEKKQV